VNLAFYAKNAVSDRIQPKNVLRTGAIAIFWAKSRFLVKVTHSSKNLEKNERFLKNFKDFS
jgi:hypothetical protein